MEHSEMTAEKLLTRAETLVHDIHDFECQLMVSVTTLGKDRSINENQLSNHSVIFQDRAMVDIATRFYGMDLAQTSYWITEGEHYYEYSSSPQGWVRNEYRQGNFLRYLESFYMLLNFPTFFARKKSFEITGTETIDGRSYITLRGTIPGPASRPVLSLVTSLTLLSILTDDESFYKDMPDIPVNVYLDEETGFVTKLVFSLKEANEKILDNAYGTEQPRPMAGIWGAVSTLVYQNYGSAPDFRLPEEAASHFINASPQEERQTPEHTTAPAHDEDGECECGCHNH